MYRHNIDSWQYSKYDTSSSHKEKYSKDKHTELKVASISSLEKDAAIEMEANITKIHY